MEKVYLPTFPNFLSDLFSVANARGEIASRLINVRREHRKDHARSSAQDIRNTLDGDALSHAERNGYTLAADAYEDYAAGTWGIAPEE